MNNSMISVVYNFVKNNKDNYFKRKDKYISGYILYSWWIEIIINKEK